MKTQLSSPTSHLKVFLASLLMIAVLSCGKMNPDKSPSAIDSNYPTAEILCDSKVHNGLAVCARPEISVQGYYNGEIRIDSDRCNIHETLSYVDSAAVNIKIADPSQPCVIMVVVSIDYPSDTVTPKRSLKGIIYYRPTNLEAWYQTSKIPTQTIAYNTFNYDKFSGNMVDVYWSGCGMDLVHQQYLPKSNLSLIHI